MEASAAGTADARIVLEGQLRECFGRVVYSHKVHEKCADILLARLSFLKNSQIVLSAITTAGLVAAVLGPSPYAVAASAMASAILLVINAYTKDFNPGTLAQKHRQTGSELWYVREEYLSLIADLRMGEHPLDRLTQRRDELLESLRVVYDGAPSTTDAAYKKAQTALKYREDLTFSDQEIDMFLPVDLRKLPSANG